MQHGPRSAQRGAYSAKISPVQAKAQLGEFTDELVHTLGGSPRTEGAKSAESGSEETRGICLEDVIAFVDRA